MSLSQPFCIYQAEILKTGACGWVCNRYSVLFSENRETLKKNCKVVFRFLTFENPR